MGCDELNAFCLFLFSVCTVDEPVVLTLTPSSLIRTRTEAEARRTSRTTTPSSSTTCCRPWTAYILDCCLAEHSLYPGLSPIRQFLHYQYDWENKISGPGSQDGGTTGGTGVRAGRLFTSPVWTPLPGCRKCTTSITIRQENPWFFYLFFKMQINPCW